MSNDSILTPFQKKLLFIALSLATFLIVLDYSIANVSIPYIAGDLSVSTDQGTYVITSFAVGNAIGLAMTGWLTKRIGTVVLLCVSLGLFTLFSLFCGLSVSLPMLVISRFIQGFVAGPMLPLSQSIIIANAEPNKLARDLSLWSTIVVAAPVLGPVLGGYLSEWHHWPWIFYINLPVGVFTTAIIWFILHKKKSVIEKAHIDIVGFFLLAIGVTCLQILLDKGQQWDWMNSNLIRILGAASIIAFVLLTLYEIFHETPFLELRLFAIPSFALSIICLAVSYGIYFGSVVLIPLWLQEFMNYDATWAGIAVCSLGLAPLCLAMLTPKIMKTFGNIGTLIISFSVFAFSSFLSAYFFTTDVDIRFIALSRFFFGAALIFYINPLISMSVSQIPTQKLPSAMGIFHFVRAMVGGIGTSVFITLFQRRNIFHHERIGATLTPYNPLLPDAMGKQDLSLLNNSLDAQAAMLSINEASFLMGWLYVGLIVLLGIWSLFRPRTQPKPEAAPHIVVGD